MSKSGRASRVSSRRWPSRKARWCARVSCCTTIDPKPLQAAVANAKANLATWQARLEKSKNDVARLKPLAAQQAVSQQELDNALAAQDAAVAQVDAAKAALEKAEFDLELHDDQRAASTASSGRRR